MWSSGGRPVLWETRPLMWFCSAASKTWEKNIPLTPVSQEVSIFYSYREAGGVIQCQWACFLISHAFWGCVGPCNITLSVRRERWRYKLHSFTSLGIAKLEVGDYLELLIPRATANITLDGEGTFMGAVKLVWSLPWTEWWSVATTSSALLALFLLLLQHKCLYDMLALLCIIGFYLACYLLCI